MSNNLECPIDNISVNENKVRIVAFFVLLLTVVFVVTNSWLFAALLFADFALRSFNFNKYSPLGILSDTVVKQLKIKNKPTDRAPKRFAALVGLLFSGFILVAVVLQLTLISQIAAGILIIFAALESFFGFCAGCYAYGLFKLTKLSKTS
ncbi:DUF4395 domain-containing protein [Mucilaginibacter sp. BJC16-A38]|uniref:DUF4395 domain-containing protein n=1 Tax=Mucilaginibacter phenanthrenivorans TaxID=1234842 RepID=UPI0021576E84|nr:DUF4395 domain-containing protein [Mucilaginibacter phenanthrenivorans]MCR8556164.1 DUF4395 domain-containing protein [Mucilaginibacter phenanthrenivorans]